MLELNWRISMCKLFAKYAGQHLHHWSICATKIWSICATKIVVNNYASTIIDEEKNDPSKNAVEENDPPKKAVEVHLHGISLLLFWSKVHLDGFFPVSETEHQNMHIGK